MTLPIAATGQFLLLASRVNLGVLKAEESAGVVVEEQL